MLVLMWPSNQGHDDVLTMGGEGVSSGYNEHVQIFAITSLL